MASDDPPASSPSSKVNSDECSASPSGSLLSGDEMDELTYLASTHAQLVLVDSRSMSLENQVNTRFNELCLYWGLLRSLRNRVVYGSGPPPRRKLANHVQRLQFFSNTRQLFLAMVRFSLRAGLVRSMPSYRFVEGEHRMEFHPITLYEDRSFRSDTASVKWPGDTEINVEEKPEKKDFSPSVRKPVKFETHDLIPTEENKNCPQHHVISRRFWSDFLNVLSNLEDEYRQESTCPQVDYRFENIMEFNCRRYLVIETWQMWTPNVNPYECRSVSPPTNLPENSRMYSDDRATDFERRLFTWSYGCNIFFGPPGPVRRGPFDPEIQGSHFEDASEPILGPERFRDFQQLFQRMERFVNLQPSERRLSEAQDIMRAAEMLSMKWPSPIPYVANQWGQRTPSMDELIRIVKKGQAKTFAGKSFWYIKQ